MKILLVKKPIQIIFLSLIAAGATRAQNLNIEIYEEFTVAHPISGKSIGCTFNDGMEAGFFYHKAIREGSDVSENQQIEKELTGFYITNRILESGKLSLFFKTRFGITEEGEYLLSPGIHTEFRPVNRVALSPGLSFRSITPSLITSVKIELGRMRPKKHNHRPKYITKLR